MNNTLKTILIVVAGLVVAAGIFFAGSWFARSGSVLPGTMMSGYGAPNGYYGQWPGMMNSRGGSWTGPGMMGRGYGGYGSGPGMMGGYGWRYAPAANVAALTVDQSRQAAEKYLQSIGLQGLEISEIMIFDNNAYVAVKETATGMGAFELLVDPVTQAAFPEYGPNMMWNLKYGALSHGAMMGGRGGMMGWWNPQGATPADVSADMPVTADQALKDAQAFLDQYRSGTQAATDPVKFYGYYTFDFTRDGTVEGMLSVNGYTGQVFLHTWHGKFIEEAE